MNLLRRLVEEDPKALRAPVGYFLTSSLMAVLTWGEWTDLSHPNRAETPVHSWLGYLFLTIGITLAISNAVLWLKAEQRVRAEKKPEPAS